MVNIIDQETDWPTSNCMTTAWSLPDWMSHWLTEWPNRLTDLIDLKEVSRVADYTTEHNLTFEPVCEATLDRLFRPKEEKVTWMLSEVRLKS